MTTSLASVDEKTKSSINYVIIKFLLRNEKNDSFLFVPAGSFSPIYLEDILVQLEMSQFSHYVTKTGNNCVIVKLLRYIHEINH